MREEHDRRDRSRRTGRLGVPQHTCARLVGVVVASVIVVCGSLMGMGASAASAASISVSVDQPTVVLTPVRQVPTLTVTATGTADATANTVYIERRDTTDPCAATYYDEIRLPFAGGSPVTEIPIDSNNSPSMGPFTTTGTTQGTLLEGPGYFRLCAYLYPSPFNGSGQQVAPNPEDGPVPPAASATALVHVVLAGSGGTGGSQNPSSGHPGSGRSGVHCVVPHILGKTRAGAKTLLGRAHCRLGKVTTPRAKKGTKFVVHSSSPKAGTRLSSGAKINVTLRKA